MGLQSGTSRQLALAMLALAVLAGCGGSGGGGGATSSSSSTGTGSSGGSGGSGGGGGGGGSGPTTIPAWAHEAYLKAPNAGADDAFGYAVAIDGDTMVVGVWAEDSNQTTITNGDTASADNSATRAGAAYVFTRSGATWTPQAYLKAPNADAYDDFGTSVAVSGDTVVVGAPNESSGQTTITNGPGASADNSATQAGAAYVFVRSGTTWTQQAYLKAPIPDAGDGFGNSVAVSGDTVVVGAWAEGADYPYILDDGGVAADNSAPYSGAAYVFVRSGTTWTQQAYLKASNAEAQDEFGTSVAVSGDTVVVSAVAEASSQTTITNSASADNSASLAGAAYVFVRSGRTWSEQAYLKAPNAEADDRFGTSVAISGDTVVVGAYREDSSQTTITTGTASVDNFAPDAGAAYVFTRSGATWTSQAYLKAPNADANDHFGISVAVSGDTVVVGATAESSNQTTIASGASASADNSAPNAGAAYVFTRSGSAWSQQAYLKAPNANAYDYFGTSVAVSGDTVVVGADGEGSSQTTVTNGATASADNSASGAGAAYVFRYQ